MALYGADVESLRQLAQTFNNKSQVLDNDVNLALKALVSATDWQGSDGDKFKDDWDSVLAPQLRNAAQALAQAGWDLTLTSRSRLPVVAVALVASSGVAMAAEV